MADKEASVFIVDLGQSMSRQRHGRDKSDLDYSLQYVWDKLSNIVYLGRKGLVVGVIGLRTDETKNHMSEEGGYEYISILQAIQNIQMEELRRLPEELKASNTDGGDALSAVILGVDMLMKHCRHLKFVKRLYLITNGTGPLDADDIEDTAAQIKQNDIKLTVLGVDFDDPEYGFKEENKPYQKRQNEQALKKLVDLSDGIYGTMDEAVEGLMRPHVKLTKAIPSYKGQLRLGDPENFDTAITIDIERYPKVALRKPPSATSYALKDGAPSQRPAEDDNLAAVRMAYSYQVKDEEAPGGWRDIPREELAKGYNYGRTAVHIAESDENITKLETEQNYEILGFFPQEHVERYMLLNITNMLVAQKLNDKAAYALSSLIHALFEVGSVAVARVVKKNMSEPQLTLLSPLITEDIECLIENDLPFAEDLRTYRFPPLDKIVTVSGKTITSHRNLPSHDLMSSMSDYIDNMSLMDPNTQEERFAIEDVFSPILHTIEGAIKYRAVHPNDPIPPKNDLLLEASKPPDDLLNNARKSLDKLIKASDVKKVPPRVKGRARWRDREADKPISGLDVDALLKKHATGKGGGPRRTVEIDPNNAIPQFKQFLDASDDTELVKEAVSKMSKITEDLIRTSVGDSNYDRALETLGVVRQETYELEMAELYNGLIRKFKERLLKAELGGDRKEFWWRVRVGKLGLIDSETSDSSAVSKEEAQKFLRMRD